MKCNFLLSFGMGIVLLFLAALGFTADSYSHYQANKKDQSLEVTDPAEVNSDNSVDSMTIEQESTTETVFSSEMLIGENNQ